MRRDEFISYLAADLKTWTETAGGQFHVARDPLHPLVVLTSGNYKSFVCILSYAGAQPLNGDQDPHGMADPRVEIYLGHAIDLRTDPSAWLYKYDPGEPDPLLKRLSDLTDRVLTIVFKNDDNIDDAYAEFLGEEQATLPDGTPLRGWKLTVGWPLKIAVTDANYRFLNAP